MRVNTRIAWAMENINSFFFKIKIRAVGLENESEVEDWKHNQSGNDYDSPESKEGRDIN